MKLSILGGGGFRTPIVYQALLHDAGSPRVDEVALYDTDAGKLDGMVRILDQLAAGYPDPPRVRPTTTLAEAVTGSDFVFAAVRVAGLQGRCRDERVALDLDVLGQETTGPGGLAYALRTVPVMLDVARTVRELAPDAYVLNFTNPAGIITEAMQSVLGDRVLGICDTPSGLGQRIAGLLGVDAARVQMDYVGLNHLGWMRRLLIDGADVLPRLLGDDAALARLEEGLVFGTDWLRTLGSVPNEYLYYYYSQREAIASIKAARQTRGEFLLATQGRFWEQLAAGDADALGLWRAAGSERNASYMAEAKGGEQGAPAEHTVLDHPELDPAQQGYAGVALAVMAAISRNERSTMILNVRNGGTIAGLPQDAVVEVPTTVDANGVHPLSTPPPDLHQLGLMQQVKAVERHTIAAAVHGDRGEALRAFALHPLVPSVDVARRLLDGYVAAIPEVARVFSG